MGYLHIDNLYKNQDILMFKECYVLEKIHGTSAHVALTSEGLVKFFSGGEKHERFVGLWKGDNPLYDYKKLEEGLKGVGCEVTIYGEAYGGKQQGMSDTYGKELRFIAFDVKIGDSWLDVPDAADFTKQCGLEFVYYEQSDTTIESLTKLRDIPSVQAVRNGVGNDKKMEGVIIRPLTELTKKNGKRVICKYKRDDFRETKAPRPISQVKLNILTEANKIAEEWVTHMRLVHVLDKIEDKRIENMKGIIDAMIEDIKREAEGEIVYSKEVEKAISRDTAIMFKQYLKENLNNVCS